MIIPVLLPAVNVLFLQWMAAFYSFRRLDAYIWKFICIDKESRPRYAEIRKAFAKLDNKLRHME